MLVCSSGSRRACKIPLVLALVILAAEARAVRSQNPSAVGVLSAPQQKAYFVSSSTGNDSWPGTSARPWRSLGKVSSVTFGPGSAVLLKRGDTWRGEELILNGDGDPLNGKWITLGAYGDGPKPRITSPPLDMTPGLVDWTVVNEAYPGTNREFMSIAVRIEASLGGWVIRGLEIDSAEMGIYGRRDLLHAHLIIEDCHIHDIDGLRMPVTPTWQQDSTMWSPMPEPPFGSAIWLQGENFHFRDLVIERCTGGIGRFLTASEIENVYIDKVWSGAVYGSGSSLKTSESTILNAQWPDGAWWGVTPFLPVGSTDFRVERCEIAYTDIYLYGGDAGGMDFDALNVECALRDCFVHDNYGPGVEILGENHYASIDNNVFYANGHELPATPWPEPAFSLDASFFFPASSGSIANNLIFKRYAGQYLNFYYWPKYPYYMYSNDFKPHPGFAVVNNSVQEFGTYTLPLPIPVPPPIAQLNLAPAAVVTVSSGGATASAVNDGVLGSDWVSREPMPTVRLEWTTPHAIDAVRLFDRPDLDNWCTSGTLSFSDGSRINLTGGILNNGAMREVRFGAKTVTSVEFVVTRSTGMENGLTELEVFEAETPVTELPPDPGDFKVDFQDRPEAATRLTGDYPSHWGIQNALDWRLADWTTAAAGGNRFLYVDFPGQHYLGRMFQVPKGRVLKRLSVSGPVGSEIHLSMNGQLNGIAIPATPAWTAHDTGWTLPGFSDVVSVSVYSNGVSDITFVKIDDLVYGD